jgi:hypothetical protein
MYLSKGNQEELGLELDAKLETARKNLMTEDEFTSPNRPQDDKRQAVSSIIRTLSAVKSGRKPARTPGTTTKEKIRSEMILGTESNPTSYDVRAYHVTTLFTDVVEADDLLAETPANSKDKVQREVDLAKERLSELLATTPGPRFKIPTQYRTDEEKLAYLDDRLDQVHEAMVDNLNTYRKLTLDGDVDDPGYEEQLRPLEDSRMKLGKRFLRLNRARDEIAPLPQATSVAGPPLTPVSNRTRTGRSRSVETESEPTKRGVSVSTDIPFTRDTIGMLSMWYPSQAMNWVNRGYIIRDQLLFTADGQYFISQDGQKRAATSQAKILKAAKSWQILNGRKTYPQPLKSDTILSPEQKVTVTRPPEPDPYEGKPVTERYYQVLRNLSNINETYDEKSRKMLMTAFTEGKQPIIRLRDRTVFLNPNDRLEYNGTITQTTPSLALDIAGYFNAIAPKQPDQPSSIKRVPRPAPADQSRTLPDPRLPTALTPSSPFGEVRRSSLPSTPLGPPKATVIRDEPSFVSRSLPLRSLYPVISENSSRSDEPFTVLNTSNLYTIPLDAKYAPDSRRRIGEVIEDSDYIVLVSNILGYAYAKHKDGAILRADLSGVFSPVSMGGVMLEQLNATAALNGFGRTSQGGSGMSHQNGYDLVPTTRKRPLIDNYEYDDCSHHVSDGFSFGQHLTKYARHN